MAEGKKSFIAYSDWSGTFKAIPDEIAGQLIKYIFSYVNDENPEPHENYVVNALFEQIKATLKRDLDKWDKQRKQRSEAGKKSAKVRATKMNDRSTTVNEKKRKATVNVNDNVNVSTNVDDDVLFSIDKLKSIYLENKKLVNSICRSQDISESELKTNIDLFNIHLSNSGQFAKKWIDYTTHFLSWLKIQLSNKDINENKVNSDEARKHLGKRF